jgi:hypothetical protein
LRGERNLIMAAQQMNPLFPLHVLMVQSAFINPYNSFKPEIRQNNTVTYRPVVKRLLCKQRPLLRNGAVNTPLQRYKSCGFYVIRAEIS